MSDTATATTVAGDFFSDDPETLSRDIDRLLRGCAPAPAAVDAVVSPHAGYAFSGALTARALAVTAANEPDVVVILSPSHHLEFDGLALPKANKLQVPGGTLSVATKLRKDLMMADLVQINEQAFEREHGIEVQLPILHRLHPRAQILPLVIGRSTPEDVARVVDEIVAQTRKPLFVLSSDLSHFMNQKAANVMDASTAERLETGEMGLAPRDACGYMALNGYIASAHAQGSRILRLGMANSSAISKDAKRTVGYGAWSISAADTPCLSAELRQELLYVTRQVLMSRLTKGHTPTIETNSFKPEFRTFAASFVTLEQEGRLRGCIGSLRAHRPMIEDVTTNAQTAALQDPRFTAMTDTDLATVKIKIALLSPMRPIDAVDQDALEAVLVPGRDGLVLRDGSNAAAFLPEVWAKLPKARDFVQALKRKAGLADDYWSDTMQVEVFQSESFGET